MGSRGQTEKLTFLFESICSTINKIQQGRQEYIRELYVKFHEFGASQVVLVVKNPPANAGDVRDLGSSPGSGRSPGGGHGNPLQYSCLENSMDRRAMGYHPWGHTVGYD